MIPCTLLLAFAPELPFTLHQQAQFGSSEYDGVYGLEEDGRGGTFTVGATGGELSAPSAGLDDAFIVRLDSLGRVDWARQFGTPQLDAATAVMGDGAGGAYVCGYVDGTYSPSSSPERAFLAHYSDGGQQLSWTVFDTSSLGGMNARATALARSSNGDILVAGHSLVSVVAFTPQYDGFLARFDAQGQLQTVSVTGTALSSTIHGVAPDGQDGAVVAGAVRSGSFHSPDIALVHFDASGARTWTQIYGTPFRESVLALRAAPGGGYYVGGATYGTMGTAAFGREDCFVQLVDSQGAPQWTYQFGSSESDKLMAMTVDPARGVFACGMTTGDMDGDGNGGSNDAFVSLIDPSGGSSMTYQTGGAAMDQARGVALDGRGGLFVAGMTEGSIAGPSQGGSDGFVMYFDLGIGDRYCDPARINSSGFSGRMHVLGTPNVAANSMALVATQLPPSAFGFFLTSDVAGYSPHPGGSQGILCLGGSVGRYVGPGQVGNTGVSRSLILDIDLTRIPHPSLGSVSVQSGTTRRFQAWYRDMTSSGTPTSNFTDAVAVQFE